MLSVENLTFKRNGKKIFAGLGFTLFNGALLNIIGPNGSGKSSFLKILTMIYKNQNYKIFFNEANIYECNELYKDNLIYISHNDGLKNELTVFENLKFWADIANKELALNAAIFTLGLGEYEHVKISALSKGFKKRVSLARLLLSNAKIWIMDEPFCNLDPEAVSILTNMISARLNQNGIVIITSHEQLNLEGIMRLELKDYN